MLMAIEKIGQSLNAALELRKLTVDLLPQKLPVQNPRMRAHCHSSDRLSRKDVSGKGTCEIEVQPREEEHPPRSRGFRPGRRQNHRACRGYHAPGCKLQYCGIDARVHRIVVGVDDHTLFHDCIPEANRLRESP